MMIAIAIAIAIVLLDIGHVPTVYKYFVDLYHASLKDKSKHDGVHATKNTIINANIEINNALVKKISLAHEVAKSLEILKFFENLDSNDKASDW